MRDVSARCFRQIADESDEGVVPDASSQGRAHPQSVVLDLRRFLPDAEHFTVRAIDALACALSESEEPDRLCEQPVPRSRRVGEDVVRRHAGHESAGTLDREALRGVLDIHRSLCREIAVDQCVDYDLAHGARRVIGEGELKTARKVEWPRLDAGIDELQQRLDRVGNRAVSSDCMRRFASRRWPVVIRVAVRGNDAADQVLATEEEDRGICEFAPCGRESHRLQQLSVPELRQLLTTRPCEQ